MNLRRSLACLLVWVLCGGTLAAQDSDRFRPYLRFHSGDIEPLWGVDDHWSFGLGADFNRHWGGELALDFFERDYRVSGIGELGEVAAWNLIPEVRLRRAFRNGRLVPYLIAGIGPSFLQLNDRKSAAYGRDFDIEGMTFAVAGGAGVEYFFADNLSFGVEGRYLWINPIEGKVDGQRHRVDMSSAMFTFGLRAYFSENDPRPLLTLDSEKQRRFYFGVRVGGSVLTDDHLGRGLKFEPEPSALGGVVNQTGALTLGVDLRAPWGLEVVADSLEQKVRLAGVGSLGEYGMGIVIPQVRLRHPMGRGKWVPYATAGVGAAYGEVNDRREVATGERLRGKGIYPALSLGAGLEYFIVRNLSLHTDLRWLYSWGHELRVSQGPKQKGDFSALLMTIGFRAYLFEF
ncbi:MAG: porin family protein [Verrucomicrobiae bacterium]|nr:porin family protein [Verrucomicrobiae bacterium]